VTVKELAQKLNFSEPTIRRDLTELHRRGIITKRYGGAILNEGAADREIPFVIRENEKSQTKAEIGLLASKYISDGMVIMLDGVISDQPLPENIAALLRR
jgi:DeoR/GlpR family transcriptional regulator of sugar metabolism